MIKALALAIWELFVTAIEIVIVAMLLITTVMLDLLGLLIELVIAPICRYLFTRRV